MRVAVVTETLSLRRAATTKTLSAPGIKRCRERPDMLSAAKKMDGIVDVSAKHRGLGNGKEMRTVLVGQAYSGAEIRDATTTSHGSR